jgi:membrane-associated phospholipid phosphatase
MDSVMLWWSGERKLSLTQLNPIPQKYRPSRKLRLRQQDQHHDITRLQTSFDVRRSFAALRRHKWRVHDLQYLLVFAVLLFSLSIMPPAPLLKSGVMVILALVLLMPITQQFFLPSLPIWVYLVYFFSSRFIDADYRPHIWVKVLPALENVLYGANLSNIISAHTNPVLDILAWIPYGLCHFSLPLICSGVMFFFAAPGTVPVFARAFGYMCMAAVTIQILFPCTPPWYEKAYGLEPAHYGMQGSPAGLARIDALLGFDMYTTSFTTAPVPFGAFPSLHGGNAVLEALFMQWCFPRFRPFYIAYVGWIWWATMYLNHHYAIDLVAGGLLAAIAYFISRARWLPQPQPDKKTRWEYEYVEYGNRVRTMDEEYGYGMARRNSNDWSGDYYGLGLLERRSTSSSDEWTTGSSSSRASSSRDSLIRGDSSASGSSTPGSLSPAALDMDEDQFHRLKSQSRAWDPQQRLSRETVREIVVR